MKFGVLMAVLRSWSSGVSRRVLWWVGMHERFGGSAASIFSTLIQNLNAFFMDYELK
jgi:hypothetical protein